MNADWTSRTRSSRMIASRISVCGNRGPPTRSGPQKRHETCTAKPRSMRLTYSCFSKPPNTPNDETLIRFGDIIQHSAKGRDNSSSACERLR
jgi:hypothetical protein